MPPLALLMTLVNDATTVSYPVPHRSATSTSQVRSTPVCITPFSSAAFSRYVPVPAKITVSVTGRSSVGA